MTGGINVSGQKGIKHFGEQIHKYENLLNRNFEATAPNQKWVTDISYIHTSQGVLYLSMIRDAFDRSIVSYKTWNRTNCKFSS